ncbi:MAG: VCBS repeat-containing protein [Candidatus Fermentibacteraceae bacterium]
MDWNDDGLEDLIVGDRLGMVNHFRRLPDGSLTAMPPVSTPQGRIEVGHNSAPEVFDWNGDGLPDLLVGRADPWPGSVILYTNSGTPGDPLLADSCFLDAGGEHISYTYSVPRVFDLDRDGRHDLVLGEASGHVYWFRNTGTSAEPVLEEGVMLECEDGPVFNGTSSRIWVGDYDADGIPDLLLGDYSGLVHLYRGSDTTGVAEPGCSGLEIRPAASPATTIRAVVSSGQAREATLLVFSVHGRLIGSVDGSLVPGRNEMVPELEPAPGVYLMVLRSGELRASCRVVLLDEDG